MLTNRLRYLLIVPLLLAGLWLAWPSPPKDGDSAANPTPPVAMSGDRGTSPLDNDPSGTTRPPRIKDRSLNNSDNGDNTEASARIERILGDDKISTTDAAVMLHAMAADTSLPVSARHEALQHGLNLDMTPFARFGEAADLPAELATEFLNAVINFNESPELQIKAYLALLNHPDPEVSESATDMLAFVVEDDQREADAATLVKMAQQKLLELSQAPPETN